MHIARLSLSNFRSYADAYLEAAEGLVVLTGENGAGKTNVLEAVSLFGPGRGLRGAALKDMARSRGPGNFAVAARLEPGGIDAGGAAPLDIGTGTSPEAPERRQVRINGAPASGAGLAEWLSLLWLTPAMDRIFSETATGRRRFFDRLTLALDPGHAGHSARYEAAMRSRNKLLAEEGEPDGSWLAAIEQAMAEHGAAIAAARTRTLHALSERLALQPQGPFARAALAFDRWTGEGASAEVAALVRTFQAGRSRDAAAGRALEGPHRTDLIVTHVDKDVAAELCSTGEQKALLLSIILAHAELVSERLRRAPILLLDEVVAHLDPLRRAALFERLASWGGQVWMTGTERALFQELAGPVTWLKVENGRIETS